VCGVGLSRHRCRQNLCRDWIGLARVSASADAVQPRDPCQPQPIDVQGHGIISVARLALANRAAMTPRLRRAPRTTTTRRRHAHYSPAVAVARNVAVGKRSREGQGEGKRRAAEPTARRPRARRGRRHVGCRRAREPSKKIRGGGRAAGRMKPPLLLLARRRRAGREGDADGDERIRPALVSCRTG
jgi:hypothetical protein